MDEERRTGRFCAPGFARRISGASAGPAFIKLMAMRPSGSDKICDGTFANLSRRILSEETTLLRLMPRAAIKNDGVAITVVALWIFVRLDDENTALTFGRNRPCKLHLDVAAGGICGDHQRILASFRTADDFEVQGFAGHGVVNGFVARGAALADRIESTPLRRALWPSLHSVF